MSRFRVVVTNEIIREVLVDTNASQDDVEEWANGHADECADPGDWPESELFRIIEVEEPVDYADVQVYEVVVQP